MKPITAEALAGAVRSHARTAARSRRAINAAIAIARCELDAEAFKAWLRSTFAASRRRQVVSFQLARQLVERHRTS